MITPKLTPLLSDKMSDMTSSCFDNSCDGHSFVWRDCKAVQLMTVMNVLLSVIHKTMHRRRVEI